MHLPTRGSTGRAALAAAATLGLLASTTASAAFVEHYWNVEWVPGVNPDGLSPRSAIGVNGTWPPPIVNVNASDVLRMHVTNKLGTGVGTAMHTHGLYFNRTVWMDGAVGVTQCPIPPDESFTYEPLNSALADPNAEKQVGTYWMHGHYKGQYVDGFRTPFIIHPDTPETQPYKYDEDYTIIISDWYHDSHEELLDTFMTRANPTGAEPVPKSALLYIASTPANGSAATYLPGFNENATLPFTPGKTYRLRVINMSALAMFHFWIDGHQMRIIELDGVDTEESPVDVFPLSAAQRTSVLVTARNDSTAFDWKIHADMSPDMFDVVPDDLQLNVTSRISYGAAPRDFGAETAFDEFPYFDDTAFVPVIALPMVPADVVHNLSVVFDTYSDGKNYASFNGKSYAMPNTPSLLSLMSMGAEASNMDIYGPTSGAIAAPYNQMIEMTIFNTDAGFHPFHMHGRSLQLVHKSRDVSSDDPEINPPLIEGKLNPSRRDTFMVPPGGSATVRFRADNPGAWLMHCHIAWHLDSGLGLVVIEAPEQAQQRMASLLPGSVPQQCLQSGLSATGNAAGLNSTTDFTGLMATEPVPLENGWTPKAIGAFVGSALSALLGLATVIYYGLSGSKEEDQSEGEEKDAQ